DCQRWNMLHPEEEPKLCYVQKCLNDREGPIIAATDYVKAYANQLSTYLPCRRFVALGTDGFGRSDTRANLRRHFEVNRHYIALAALKALADDGMVEPKLAADALKRFGIDVNKPNPLFA
ncbi:MAG: transketolase-like TK C-terminal-containing protein, partial [Gammaproteobacteria bacterium]